MLEILAEAIQMGREGPLRRSSTKESEIEGKYIIHSNSDASGMIVTI